MCVQYVYSKLCELHILLCVYSLVYLFGFFEPALHVCTLTHCVYNYTFFLVSLAYQLSLLSVPIISSLHLSFLSPSLPPSFSPSPSLPPSPSLSLSLSLPLSFSQEVLRLIKEDKEAEASQLLRSDKELLHEACESGSVEAVNLLLDRGVTVSEWNKVSNYTYTQ